MTLRSYIPQGRTALRPCGILLLSVSISFAASADVLGGHEGWLDRMGAGVREMGRGNTGTALIDATPAAYWNPALLPYQRKPQVAVGAEVRSLDRNGGYVSFQERLAGNLGIGIGVINRGDLNVTAYDADETPSGTARPQSFASYLGVGIRSSRRNAYGVTVHMNSTFLDVEPVSGLGNVTFVGGLNFGWYRRLTDSLSVAVVLRNLGLNENLSAEFDQTTSSTSSDNAEFQSTTTDFFPKTLVVAVEWHKALLHRAWSFSGEVVDYQLQNSIFTPNPAFHAQAVRLGAECEIAQRVQLRGGLDRGNLTFGFGYGFAWSRRRVIQFDYALVLERGWMTFNPYAIGLKTTF